MNSKSGGRVLTRARAAHRAVLHAKILRRALGLVDLNVRREREVLSDADLTWAHAVAVQRAEGLAAGGQVAGGVTVTTEGTKAAMATRTRAWTTATATTGEAMAAMRARDTATRMAGTAGTALRLLRAHWCQ